MAMRGPEYFCDRVDETAMLTNLLTNGNPVWGLG